MSSFQKRYPTAQLDGWSTNRQTRAQTRAGWIRGLISLISIRPSNPQTLKLEPQPQVDFT
jgi:hypothetical protein